MNPTKHYAEELNQRIKVIPGVATKSTRGTVTYTHDDSTAVSMYASIEPYGAYIYNGQALKADCLQYRVVVRFRAWIDRNSLVVWNGLKLKQTIPPIDVNAKHTFLQLTCEAVK